MKIYYFSFTRFPSEKAHSLYIAKVCEAFASIDNLEVKVVVPRRFLVEKLSCREFYNLQVSVPVLKLPSIDVFLVPGLKNYAIYIGIITFTISSCFYSMFKISRQSIIITNVAFVGWVLSYLHKNIIYELHDYPNGSLWLYKSLFKRVRLIQTNNKQKQLLLRNQFNVLEEKMYVAHNGVTIRDFDLKLSKREVRSKLGLNLGKKIAVYTGHLYDWKGADVLAEAAILLPDIDFLFIGGNEQDVAKMKLVYKIYSNIKFLGFKPYKEIPLYQRAADVLVVPNTAKKEISRLHTSPMKIFEYMASKTPIVASDIPSIREILNDRNSILCIPDQPLKMAKSIEKVFLLSERERDSLAEQASMDVKKHAWRIRAEKIIDRIS